MAKIRQIQTYFCKVMKSNIIGIRDRIAKCPTFTLLQVQRTH